VNINVTLFGQMITFLLFVIFTKKFVWPPIIKALKERQGKIADGLAAAERGHHELAKAQEQIALELKQTKESASNIIVEARKQADSIVDASRQQAHEEGVRIIQQAHSEIEHMIAQAKEDLRKQVATIAMLGAEKVLERSIDAKAHQELLDKLAQEI
jgi:F-type H+-transporting ATPase subunit b